MDSLRLDSWILGWNIQRLFFSFCKNRRRQGKAREGKGNKSGIYDLHNLFQDTHDD